MSAISGHVLPKGMPKLIWPCKIIVRGCEFCQPVTPARAHSKPLISGRPPAQLFSVYPQMMAVSNPHFASICLLNVVFAVIATRTFLPNTPGREWKMVGYLDMTDPTQQCPDSWQKITSPRSSCGKKSTALCDSLNITTSGASYTRVCGRFRGYQGGSPDAFGSLRMNIETHYVDGVTVTYGSPGNRHHVYTYAAGVYELTSLNSCPCTVAGIGVPVFVGSDFYCESGCPGLSCTGLPQLYSPDVLWDRQQCGGNEGTCCDPPNIPWFCKTFPNPISEDLEIRICTDEGLDNENVAIESFELYIQGEISFVIHLV